MEAQLRVQQFGFEANIIENHDEPRGVSRFLPEYARNPMGTKMLGTINILLRGIPFVYQGQEIGMQNAQWRSLDEFNDISTIDQYHMAREAGFSDEEALEVCAGMSRDNARTPMQWSAEKYAGFTTGTPWIKLNSNYKEINVEEQEKDSDSVLHYYRSLLAVRKSPEYREVFTYGSFVPVYENTESVMAYYRVDGKKRMLVVGNFGREAAEVCLEYPVKRIVLSNQKHVSIEETKEQAVILKLQSCQAVVLECE